MGWLGPSSTVCRANAVAMEGPGLSPRYRVMRGSSGGGGRAHLGAGWQSRGPVETQFPGKVVGICTRDCQAGTDFSYPTGLSVCFKMSF